MKYTLSLAAPNANKNLGDSEVAEMLTTGLGKATGGEVGEIAMLVGDRLVEFVATSDLTGFECDPNKGDKLLGLEASSPSGGKVDPDATAVKSYTGFFEPHILDDTITALCAARSLQQSGHKVMVTLHGTEDAPCYRIAVFANASMVADMVASVPENSKAA